jgi:hypothetical protein
MNCCISSPWYRHYKTVYHSNLLSFHVNTITLCYKSILLEAFIISIFKWLFKVIGLIPFWEMEIRALTDEVTSSVK